MAFAYYRNLNRRQRQIYRDSDGVTAVPLNHATHLRPRVRALAEALASGKQVVVRRESNALLAGLTGDLGVVPVRTRVLARRPSTEWEELHGFYQPLEGRRQALITVWMRTAKRGQIVAFRTFMRTLLHEFCHHLDYEYFGLEESFHTEGFYKRESSLFHQLVISGAQHVEARDNAHD